VDGTIDCVATDHAPHALSEKEGEFAEAANGIVGLETAVPLLLDRLVRPGVLDLPTLVTRFSTGPARLLKPARGQPGPRGHRPTSPFSISSGPGRSDPAAFRSRGRSTPFAGSPAPGAPWMTLVGGVTVGVVTRPVLLALADGRVFRGEALGAAGESHGEVVFKHVHDRLPGDPHRPVVPGADGLHDLSPDRQLRHQPEDVESRRPWLAGFIVKEACPFPSSWRARVPLDTYLREHQIVGNPGDRHPRPNPAPARSRRPGGHHLHRGAGREAARGAGRGRCPACSAATRHRGERDAAPRLGRGAVGSGPRLYQTSGAPVQGHRARLGDQAEHPALPQRARLRGRGDAANTSAAAVLERKPDGVFLANGPAIRGGAVSHRGGARARGEDPDLRHLPGQPDPRTRARGSTYKLKFGHHGGNHPVKDLSTGRVEITAQNHGFRVDPRSFEKLGLVETHVNLNDGTCGGDAARELPIFSVQYHPEASPGPHDSHYLFRRFR